MALFWQVVTLLSVWLLYGFAASLFVKGSNKRDYLLLISSGLLGGLIGGRIGKIKLGVAILSMHTLQNIFKWSGLRK
jgi:hypothetical protein